MRKMMRPKMGRKWVTFFLLLLVACGAIFSAAADGALATQFAYDEFIEVKDTDSFKFLGDASIDGGALQLTPDTSNDDHGFFNKSGRIFWPKAFKLWHSEDIVASFVSSFTINIYRQPGWDAGEGFAFVIAPNLTIPEESHGLWLGLTNATSDGDDTNQMVAVEFDTEKQEEYDPDDNHIGLNINTVRSNKTASLSDFGIEISPEKGTNYSVWVRYDGERKLMEVYMAKEGDAKPEKPFLSHSVNLKHYVNQHSYFGFAASTGQPAIQLNCVLKWKLEMEILPGGRGFMWWALIIPAAILALICAGVYMHCRKRREDGGDVQGELGNLMLPGMPREFKYKVLKKATKNFNESMKLGEGGFGIVYKGVLYQKNDGEDDTSTEIAVKKFSRDDIRSKDDFMAELTIIHRLRHKHLVRLVGWCYEKAKLLLVYDFMPNGSLDKHLFVDPYNNLLNWERRYKILTGVASALHYLHNEFDQKVVHRDLKGSNIMLDSDFNARLGDFGLARALDNGRSSYAELGQSGIPGTLGYVAPECFHTQKATVESDVYAFGAVVLEVVCGRSPGSPVPHDQELYSLVDWVWMLHREGRILEAVDERLGRDYVEHEARRLLLLGLACSHPLASERPQTLAIVQIILGSVSVPCVPPFRPIFTWSFMASSFGNNTTWASTPSSFGNNVTTATSILSSSST